MDDVRRIHIPYRPAIDGRRDAGHFERGLAGSTSGRNPQRQPAARQEDSRPWFDTTAFQRQAPNTFGNAGVGTITDPGIGNIDFALQKRFRIGESKQLEFRAEAFNLFNSPLFQGVSRSFGSSTFGKLTSSQYERELQMGLKLYF